MPLLLKLSKIFKAKKDKTEEKLFGYEEFFPGRTHRSLSLENNNMPTPPRRGQMSPLNDALDLALPDEADDRIQKKGVLRRIFGRILPRSIKRTVMPYRLDLSKKRLNMGDSAHLLKTVLLYHDVKETYPGNFSRIFIIRKTKRGQPFICKIGRFGPNWRQRSVFGESHDEYMRETEAFSVLKRHSNIVEYDSTAQVYLPKGSDDTTQVFSIATNEHLSDTLLMSVILVEKLEMSLTEWMDANRMYSLNEDMTKAIFEQIGGALRYCHTEYFICHQDLKSDNIAVVRNLGSKKMPHLKLIDFGLSQIYTASVYALARQKASNILLANNNESVKDIGARLFGTPNFVCLKNPDNAFLIESFKFANMLVGLSYARTNDQITDDIFKNILFTMAPVTGLEQVTIEWALENFRANM